MKLERFKTKKSIAVIILLIAITYIAFSIRVQPARFGEIQALDPFYIYRISEYAVNNGLQMPSPDLMRNYPFGTNPYLDTPLPFLLPAAVYLALGGLGMHYLEFAILWPAIMGTIAVFFLFFVGKELFDSKKAGLLAAFFAAVTPAFISRTSAGFFEKEGIAVMFMAIGLWLFIRAYKRGDWKAGIVGGIAMALMIQTWGGASYFLMLLSLFALVVLLLNQYSRKLVYAYAPIPIIAIILAQPLPFHTGLMTPPALFSLGVLGLMVIRYLAGRFKLVRPSGMPYLIPAILVLGFVGIMVASTFVEPVGVAVDSALNTLRLTPGVELSTVAESQPGSWGDVKGRLGIDLARNMFPEIGDAIMYLSLWLMAFLGIIALAVKTNKNWIVTGIIALLTLATLALLERTTQLPFGSVEFYGAVQIAIAIASITILGFLYIGFKDREKTIFILPLLWLFSAVFGVFGFVRLLILIGPPAALLAGFFGAWLIDKGLAYKGLKSDKGNYYLLGILGAALALLGVYFLLVNVNLAIILFLSAGVTFLIMYSNIPETKWEKLKHFVTGHGERKPGIVAALVVTLLIFLIAANGAVGSVYSQQEGPSICFPHLLAPGEKCVEIQADGSLKFAEGQPWYQAFEYLSTQTPENSNILSWWDFGYWFQTRGQRPSVTDGGFGIRDEVALWYVADTQSWDDFNPWLKGKYGVDYILMDYTLPGKYGAISKIAYRDKIVGISQFAASKQYNEEGITVQEFSNGPYRIWIPVATDGNIGGVPRLLVVGDDGAVHSQTFINDICTAQGIVRVGNETASAGGCVALSQIGVFYVPPEAEHTIFNSLMFMEGYGLPVEKVFDNTLIQIYRVNYAEGEEGSEI